MAKKKTRKKKLTKSIDKVPAPPIPKSIDMDKIERDINQIVGVNPFEPTGEARLRAQQSVPAVKTLEIKPQSTAKSCPTCRFSNQSDCLYGPPTMYHDSSFQRTGVIKSAYPPCPDVPCWRWKA
jgi:hypothetical protein